VGVPLAKFKDVEHLARLAAVFLVGIALFLLLRAHFVPRGFGQYGHYRPDAVGELSAKPVNFAGHQVCEGCHDEVAQLKKAGPHAHVNCEACHGAQARHADDPGSIKPQLPDSAVLCAKCHEANAAKPRGFPQVVSLEHSTGTACNRCHVPHNPKQMQGAKP
jgi:Cytochrome c554 and c-prime